MSGSQLGARGGLQARRPPPPTLKTHPRPPLAQLRASEKKARRRKARVRPRPCAVCNHLERERIALMKAAGVRLDLSAGDSTFIATVCIDSGIATSATRKTTCLIALRNLPSCLRSPERLGYLKVRRSLLRYRTAPPMATQAVGDAISAAPKLPAAAWRGDRRNQHDRQFNSDQHSHTTILTFRNRRA